ncbi:MAG TPA: CDP-alcohol phosphatidyltransferase family protein [Gemmatimonadaceae bacterium]|nr:CDP-alcohol phosphatidyltransferase family protein [Gemmatimonadaceae bacterium]
MNLPNALSAGRIVAAPLIALLPFAASWELKMAGFVLYIAAAITDYYDGVLARTRNLITDTGKLLDPLADKLLLFATFVPMYILQSSPTDWPLALLANSSALPDTATQYAFVTPLGNVALPFWIVAVIVGRELFMTIFRQAAARRGVVIAAIGPAKWKLGFQSTWVGASYFWFGAATAARHYGWRSAAWRVFANFNGIVGVVTMIVAVVLTLYSLWIYLRRYSSVFVTRRG